MLFPPVLGVLEHDLSRVMGSLRLVRDSQQALLTRQVSHNTQGEWTRKLDSVPADCKGMRSSFECIPLLV